MVHAQVLNGRTNGMGDLIISKPNTLSLSKPSMLERIDIINRSIEVRRANMRSSLAEALKAGRHLISLKDETPHGEWEKFIVQKLDYGRPEYARSDMRLWRAWQPYVDRLIEIGALVNFDNVERDFVQHLPDTVIASVGALSHFTKGDVPPIAFELALAHMEDETVEKFENTQAKKIIQVAQAIDAFPDEDTRDFARNLYDRGVRSPEIISMVPEIMQHGDLVEEIERTGTVFVSGTNNGQGRQVELSDASTTDFEIALGRQHIEKELRDQALKIADYGSGGEYYERVDVFKGNAKTILFELKKALEDAPLDNMYKVSLSIKIEK